MAGERPRYGQLLAACGAIVLIVSVFLPWYGVSFTSTGLAFTQRIGSQVASQFGNATLQSYMSSLHTRLAGYVGHEFMSLSAHQSLKTLNVVLLIVAGIGCVLALLALAGAAAESSTRAPLALLGAIAAACVLYRMISPPNPAAALLSLSLREGAWLALIGALAMAAGAVWPAARAGAGAGTSAGDAGVQDVWSGLSGWTPEA